MNTKFKDFYKIAQRGVDKSKFLMKVYRFLSKYISYICVQLNITANQITTFKIFSEIFAVALLSFGNIILSIISISLLFIGALLDNADGEIARYTNSTSLKGEYLDLIGHRIVHPAYFLFLSFGIFIVNSNLIIIILGFIAALCFSMSEISHNVETHILFKKITSSKYNIKYFSDKNSESKNFSSKIKLLVKSLNFYIFCFDHIKALTLVLILLSKQEYILYIYTPLLFIRMIYSIFYYMSNIIMYDKLNQKVKK